MTQSIARVVVTSVIVLGFASLVRAQAPDGAELYKRTCAQCHDTGANRAPARDAFQSMPAERVMAAMETGSMITMAIGRTADERKAIAEFLTGKSLSNPVVLAARAGSHVSRGIPGIRFNDRATLDRLGTEHEQHTVPGCGSGRPDSGGHPEAETQMGLRLPR